MKNRLPGNVVALAWLVMLTAAGCYNPALDSGALGCAEGNICPDGFTCVATVCCKEGTTCGAGGKGGASGTGGSGGAGGMSMIPDGGMGMACNLALACSGRIDTPGKCDPVCQTGCPCNQKCINSSTGVRCETVVPMAVKPIGLYEECAGEQCRPGSTCLMETAAACKSHCYRYCRTDMDCGGPDVARCSNVVEFDNKATYVACSAPVQKCNPWGPNADCKGPIAGRARPFPAFGCLLLSSKQPDVTVCDCAGSKKEMDECTLERECGPGLECVNVGPDPKARCRPLCAIGAVLPGAGGCRMGMICTPFQTGSGASRLYGYCRTAG